MFRITQYIARILLAVCITTLISCNNISNQNTEVGRADSLTLRIAILPIQECNILRYAKESGLATQMGINIELIDYDALMDIDTALLADVAHVYFEDSLRVSRIQEDSLRPTLLLKIPIKTKLIANKDKEITKVSELRTNMVGLTRWSQLEKWANEITASAGLGQMDVYYAQINSIPLRFNMVNNDLIDAAIMPQPWADSLNNIGHLAIQDTILYGTGLFVSPKAINDTTIHKQIQQLKVLYLEALKQTTNRT